MSDERSNQSDLYLNSVRVYIVKTVKLLIASWRQLLNEVFFFHNMKTNKII